MAVLKWCVSELSAIDSCSGDLLICPMYEEDRPPQGFASLIDWRLHRQISKLCVQGFMTSKRNEVVLMPGRPWLGFQQLVVVGLGPMHAFDGASLKSALDHLIKICEGLGVQHVGLELPGRSNNAIAPHVAIDELFSLLQLKRVASIPSLFTLFDCADTQSVYEASLQKKAQILRRRKPHA